MMSKPLAFLREFVQKARQDQRGIAAIEFALILPFMLTLYLGIVELSKGYMASQRMTLVARTLADLTAQQQQLQTGSTTNVTDSIMSNIFAASSAIMAPYDSSKLTMTVSQIKLQLKSDNITCCDAKTDWTIANNGGTKRPCQVLSPGNAAPVSTSTIPTGFTQSPSTTGALIVADVTYQYIPGFSFEIWNWKASKIFSLAQTQYMRPRGSNTLTYAASTGTKCP
jgi:Flp pilus assembly protein TadG